MHFTISKSMQLTRSNVYKEANRSHPVRNHRSAVRTFPGRAPYYTGAQSAWEQGWGPQGPSKHSGL